MIEKADACRPESGRESKKTPYYYPEKSKGVQKLRKEKLDADVSKLEKGKSKEKNSFRGIRVRREHRPLSKARKKTAHRTDLGGEKGKKNGKGVATSEGLGGSANSFKIPEREVQERRLKWVADVT